MAQSVYLINNKHYEPDFSAHMRNAAEKYGATVVELNIEKLSFFCPREEGATVKIYDRNRLLKIPSGDYVFIRTWYPNSPATVILTTILRKKNIPFTDSGMHHQHTAMHAKLTQPFLLEGIARFPDSWVASRTAFTENKKYICDTFTFPVVLKTKGAQGKRVWKCESPETLEAKIHEVNAAYGAKLFMIQEYIENDSDIRALVWKGSIIAAVCRRSDDEFLNHTPGSGTLTPIKLEREEEHMSIDASTTLGLELSGVDIVRGSGGSLLFEVNKTPDIAEYSAAVDFSIEEEIIRRILSGD